MNNILYIYYICYFFFNLDDILNQVNTWSQQSSEIDVAVDIVPQYVSLHTCKKRKSIAILIREFQSNNVLRRPFKRVSTVSVS